LPLKSSPRFADHALESLHLFQRADHREEKAHLPVAPGTQNSPQLSLKKLRVSRTEPNAAPAHERIRLPLIAEIGNLFVTAQVEHADGDLVIGRGLNDFTIGG